MADSEYKYVITGTSDLKAAQQAKASLEEASKTMKQLGKDASDLESHLKAVNAALTSFVALQAKANAASIKNTINQITNTAASGGNLGGTGANLSGGDLSSIFGIPIAAPTAAITPAVQAAAAVQQLTTATAAHVPVAKEAASATATWKQTLQQLAVAYRAAGGGIGGMMSAASRVPATMLAAGAAILGVEEAARRSIVAFAEYEQQSFKLDAALANRGQLTDSYRAKLASLSETLEKATGIKDEQWLNVFRVLEEHGANSKNIESLTEGVKNLAGMMGGDVTSAAFAMGKALEGNFSMLERLIPEIKEGTTNQEKFAIANEAIAARGAGILEAAHQGMIGGWENVKNAIKDAEIATGDFISRTEVIQVGMDIASTATRSFVDALKWLTGAMFGVSPVADGLKNKIDSVTPSMESAAESTKRFKKEMDDLKASADKAKQAFDELNKSRDAKLHRDLTQDQANKELAKASVAQQQAAGRFGTGPVADAQVARLNAQIDRKYADLEARRKNAADDAEEQANRNEVGRIDKKTASQTKKIAELTATLAKIAQLKALQQKVIDLENALDREEDFKETNPLIESSPAKEKRMAFIAWRTENLRVKKAEAVKAEQDFRFENFPGDPFHPPNAFNTSSDLGHNKEEADKDKASDAARKRELENKNIELEKARAARVVLEKTKEEIAAVKALEDAQKRQAEEKSKQDAATLEAIHKRQKVVADPNLKPLGEFTEEAKRNARNADKDFEQAKHAPPTDSSTGAGADASTRIPLSPPRPRVTDSTDKPYDPRGDDWIAAHKAQREAEKRLNAGTKAITDLLGTIADGWDDTLKAVNELKSRVDRFPPPN